MIELGLGSFDNRFPYLNNCDIRCGLWVRNAEGHLVLNNNAVVEDMIKPPYNFEEEDWDADEDWDKEYSQIDNISLNEFWKELNEKMVDYLTDISGEFVKQSDITEQYSFSGSLAHEEYLEFIELYRAD